jgi:hypothetical protein
MDIVGPIVDVVLEPESAPTPPVTRNAQLAEGRRLASTLGAGTIVVVELEDEAETFITKPMFTI